MKKSLANLIQQYRHIFNTDYTADANCMAAWLFTEGSGTTIADSSGEGNTGTFLSSGNPAWDTTDVSYHVSGSVPNSCDFGGDDYIDCEDPAELKLNRNFSITAWVKPDTTSGQLGIISHGVNEWYLRLNGGKLNFLDSQYASLLEASTTLSTSAWSFVCVTIDNSSPANITIYLNGASDGTGTTTATLNDNDYNEQGIFIGADHGATTPAEYFDGKITEIAIFNDVLTSTEINEIYDYGLKGAGGGGFTSGGSLKNVFIEW